MAVLEVENISKRFGGLQANAQAHLKVEPGKITALIGPNGAGKTTLFAIVSGFVIPDEGRVTFQGQDITGMQPFDICHLGLVRTFQRPVVPATLTVGETLKAARKAFDPKPSRLRMEWVAEFVHLNAPMNTPTGGLETLERRKLMLACLLAREPKIVLLDEPASGLTGSEIDEIDLIVRKLAQEYGISVLLIEHRLELLAMVASRVLVLDVGEIIAEGPPDSVFKQPAVRAAYFDVPIESAVGA